MLSSGSVGRRGGQARIGDGVTLYSTTIYGFHRVLHASSVLTVDMTEHPSNPNATDSPQSADWEAIARHLTGEGTPESAARFDELMAGSAEKNLVASLESIANRMAGDVPSDIDVEAALRSVRARISEAAASPLKLGSSRSSARAPALVTRWRVPFPAIAAAGLLVVGLGSWLTLGKRDQSPAVEAPRMLATGVGIRDSMHLSDGSKIVLGPLSSVKIAAGYGSSSREVEIRGDAYFDVVHDAARPFTVHVGDATIQDIGTKFAVRSDDIGGVGVSVSEGSVSLAPLQSPEPPVVLKAGDQGTLDRGGKVVAHRGAATNDDMAWLTGRLVFRETPLSEVAASMRRWYGIDLQIADPSLANRHLTATFSGEPPDRVIEVLRLALGADIERHGDTVIVRQAKGRAR